MLRSLCTVRLATGGVKTAWSVYLTAMCVMERKTVKMALMKRTVPQSAAPVSLNDSWLAKLSSQTHGNTMFKKIVEFNMISVRPGFGVAAGWNTGPDLGYVVNMVMFNIVNPVCFYLRAVPVCSWYDVYREEAVV